MPTPYCRFACLRLDADKGLGAAWLQLRGSLIEASCGTLVFHFVQSNLGTGQTSLCPCISSLMTRGEAAQPHERGTWRKAKQRSPPRWDAPVRRGPATEVVPDGWFRCQSSRFRVRSLASYLHYGTRPDRRKEHEVSDHGLSSAEEDYFGQQYTKAWQRTRPWRIPR